MKFTATGEATAPHAVTLPATLEAPRLARRFLLGALAGQLDDDLLDTALLLTTELVTNVVVHAGTAAEVTVARAGSVTVRVADRNPARLAERPAPVATAGGEVELAEGGRGLALVDALAEVWGIEHTRAGKTVWFRLETGQHAPADRAADHTTTPTAVGHQTTGPAGLSMPPPAISVPARPPRLLAPRLVKVLSSNDEIAELAAHLLDALPLTGAQVRRWVDGAAPDVVATAGEPGSDADALVTALESDQARLGELLLWPADGTLGEDGRARVALAARWMALALRGADLRRAEERRIGTLSFLAEASDLLAGSLDAARSLALLAQLPVPRLADWCTVHLLGSDGTPQLAASAHVDEAQASGLSARAGDPTGPDMARLTAAVAGGEATSTAHTAGGQVLMVVLKARHRLLGVLSMGRGPGVVFAPDEIELLADLGRRASFAVDNARLYGQQVEVAGALQAGLLPPELPRIDGLELGAAYRAARAGLEVGGDFFDLVPVSVDDDADLAGGTPAAGTWTVMIGDVCGKGAEAAAVTGVARSVLRLLAGQGRGVAESLHELNRTLRDASATAVPGRFCTAAVARIDRPRGDGASVSLRLAGHPPPVRLTAGGEATLVGTPGTLLGILDDDEVTFPETRVELSPGEALVLYTDGVVEARRGAAMLGDAGLLATARQCAGMSAQGIADRIRAATERFAGGRLHDDMAVLVLRVPTAPVARRGARR